MSRLPEPSNTSRNITKSEIQCYLCREQGHIAKNCKYKKITPDGHKFPVQDQAIIENLRKNEPKEARYRRKSPNRYQNVVNIQFNVVKID